MGHLDIFFKLLPVVYLFVLNKDAYSSKGPSSFILTNSGS